MISDIIRMVLSNLNDYKIIVLRDTKNKLLQKSYLKCKPTGEHFKVMILKMNETYEKVITYSRRWDIIDIQNMTIKQ
jgi:hypothetical protein